MDEGYTAFEGAKPLFEECDAIQKRFDCMLRKWEEFKSLKISQDGDLGYKRDRERATLNVEHEALARQSAERNQAKSEATRFIDEFANEVDLFVERLPLDESWKLYRDAIANLRIRTINVWKKAGDEGFDPALQTLKIRLEQMLFRLRDTPDLVPPPLTNLKQAMAKVGRPPIPLDRKVRAFDSPESAKYSNRQRAEILYDTKYPSTQQTKGITAIRNCYRKSHPAPGHPK